MGSLVYTQNPFSASTLQAVSVGGGLRTLTAHAAGTWGATYATGGQTFTQPTVPTNYALWAVEIISHDLGAGVTPVWDGSTATPKLLIYDEDNTSGVAAEVAADATTYAAKVFKLRLTYVCGR